MRLLGDATSYQKILHDAEVQAKVTAKEIEEQSKKVEGFGAKLESFAGRASAALAAIGGTVLLKEAFQNFAEAEGIALRLTAVLEANGRQVEALTDQYTAFAVAMEKVSTTEDDANLKTLTLAESYGVTGQAAVKATKDAIAFAAINEGNAETYLRITAAMAEGNTELAMTMGRLVPQLRGIKDESLFIAKYQRLVEAGMKAAEAETQSAAGQIKILSRDFGNALEDVGKFVAQGVQPLVRWLTEAVGWFRELPDWVKGATTGVLALGAGVAAIGPFWATFTAGAIAAKNAVVAFTVASSVNPFTWTAVAIAGVAALTVHIVQSHQAVQDYNREMDKMKAEADFAQARLAGAPERAAQRVEKAPAEKRRQVLAKELEDANRLVEIHARGVDFARAQYDELNESIQGPITRALSPELNAATASLKQQEDQLKTAKNAAQALFQQWNALDKAAGLSPKVLADTSELILKMTDTVTTFGMSAEAAALYKLEQQGLTGELANYAAALVDEIALQKESAKAAEDATKAHEQFQKSVADTEESLRQETEALRLKAAGERAAADLAKIDALERKGLDVQTSMRLRGMADEKAALEEQIKLQEEGKKVKEDVRTPEEQFAAEQEKMGKLLEAGTIDQITYARAVEKAQKELDKAGKTASATGQKFDAVLAGSAEAASRVAAFRDQARGDNLFKGEVRKPMAFDFEDQRTPAAVEPLAPTEFEIDIGGDEIVGVLEQIRDLLERDDAEAVVLRPAGVLA